MFFALPNLTSMNVFECPQPWDYKSEAPYHLEKPDFTAWTKHTDTDHCFIKGVEGLSPGLRVNMSNPAACVHALVADYDGMVSNTESPVDIIIANAGKIKDVILPTYVALSRGGKPRLIWLFSVPITVESTQYAEQFLKYVGTRVKANKFFADLDKASFDATTYFEVGRKWRKVPGAKPIHKDLLLWWDFDLIDKQEKKTAKTYNIPMEKLAEEAESRWPGRVKNFTPGAHCLRFWDPQSDNETGCVIHETGVRVFVPHDKPFMTWADIFGRNFVDQWMADQFSGVIENCFFDADRNQFWTRSPSDGSFQNWTLAMFRSKLGTLGVPTTRGRSDNTSPVEDLTVKIAESRRVQRALYYLWHKPGLIIRPNGERILNISNLRPAEPGAPLVTPGLPWEHPDVVRAFPYIHGLVTSFFHTSEELRSIRSGAKEMDLQLTYLVSWIASYYQRSYHYTPGQGQVLFLCGPTGKGKTLFSRLVMSSLMGGFADASNYFVGQDSWTEEFTNVGVLSIDDDEMTNRSVSHRTFQSRIKKFAANGAIISNAKFRSTGTVPLHNRLIVTLNEDLVSRSILPPLDASTSDKISFLQMSAGRFTQFGNNHEENLRRVLDETPAFARWLIEYDIPEELQDKRFGVKALHNQDLFAAAALQGSGMLVLEAMQDAMSGFDDPFEGGIQQLLTLLSTVSKDVEKNLNSRNLQWTLATLEKQGYDITVKVDTRNGLRTYVIPPDVATKGPCFARERREMVV